MKHPGAKPQPVSLSVATLTVHSVWLGTWPQMDRVETQRKLTLPHLRESRYEEDRVHFNQW